MIAEDIMLVVLMAFIAAFTLALLDRKYEAIRIKPLYRESFVENLLVNLALGVIGIIIVLFFF